MKKPTEKDYADYLRGLIKGLQEDIKETQDYFDKSEKQIFERILLLEESIEVLLTRAIENFDILSKRIFALEEKERQRAREEFQREQALDFKNAEGLGEI